MPVGEPILALCGHRIVCAPSPSSKHLLLKLHFRANRPCAVSAYLELKRLQKLCGNGPPEALDLPQVGSRGRRAKSDHFSRGNHPIPEALALWGV